MSTCNSFKRVDAFGQKIQLTYKKSNTFQTTIGASITLCIIFAMVFLTADGFTRVGEVTNVLAEE
jgi:hypothetical protein